MKYNPEKKTEFSVPLALWQVISKLRENVSEKKQRKGKDGDLRYFFGKFHEDGFDIAPNKGILTGYVPTVKADLTSVTESKPAKDGAGVYSNSFTRLALDMNMSSGSKAFSVLWSCLCAVLLGLALWLNLAKGFQNNWWTLLIGPVLFIGERIACNIGFRVNAHRVVKAIKEMLKE
ncbi:MAG: hypothetical protein K6G56_05025 [Clostridiales bacterium]|nr:hypothetical protein [Clostridiales bacterium]